MTPRKWALVFAVLFVLSALAAVLIHRYEGESKVAKVYLNHQVIKTVDLAKVKTPYVFRVDTGDGGYNDIEVRPGEIAILKANCPDQVCVHQGAISSGVEPIVCLPHKLIIRIEGEAEAIHGPVQSADKDDHHHTNEGVDTVTK